MTRRVASACLAACLSACVGAGPAAAHDIHADPSIHATLLPAGTALQRCSPSGCDTTRELRVISLQWAVNCNLKDDTIRNHWEVGLRTQLDPGGTLGAGPLAVDGVADPASGAAPVDDVFSDAPETLVAFADGVKGTGGTVRVGVLPGTVLRPRQAAKCLTTEDGDSSPLAVVEAKSITVPPKAALLSTPRLRAGHAATVTFDLSVNGPSLLRTTGAGDSGAVLHVGTTAHKLSVQDVTKGRTSMKVTPRAAGPLSASLSLSGVRSANTIHLTVR